VPPPTVEAEPGVPDEALDDLTTPPRGLPAGDAVEEPGPADSAPEISSEGLAWEPKSENSRSLMPAEIAESLSNSGAIATTPPRPKNAPPGEAIDGWSESLVGWIPEESRIAAMPEVEGSKSSLVLVAVIAAVVVGGGGIAAAVMLSGDEPDPVAAAPESKAPELAPAVAAAPDPEPQPELAPEPASDPEPELILDEDDLVLDGEGELKAADPSSTPTPTKKKKSSPRPASDVGSPASGPVVNLSAGMVRREIAQNMFHIHRCYDTALKRDNTLEGRYSVTITIGTNGRVSRAVIDRDTLGHPGVASCVKRKLKSWRFPLGGRLSEPTEVSFPVTFKR
jgi:hypothetical protein